MTLSIIAIAIILIPTLFVVVIPLIDKILNDNTIQTINNIIDNIEYFLWSNGTTLLFGTIWIIMAISVIRRILTFITWNNANNN